MSKLTIGMSTYDDYHGVFFTLMGLKMYQNLAEDVELMVVDNNPESNHGKEVAILCKKIRATYIPYTKKTSTSTRDEIFKQAKGDYVLSLDCHVLLHNGSVDALLRYYKNNPDSKDIVSGPMMYEWGDVAATQMNEVWRDHMYGTWAINDKGLKLNKPFETRMMGLGAFSCKKSNWPGFNKHFRGFGGEEGYIHAKIRKQGGRSICIPDFKWLHRFVRPDGVKYPLNIEDRIFNYFIGWLEITEDPNHMMVQNIKRHFIEQTKNETMVNNMLEEAKRRV